MEEFVERTCKDTFSRRVDKSNKRRLVLDEYHPSNYASKRLHRKRQTFTNISKLSERFTFAGIATDDIDIDEVTDEDDGATSSANNGSNCAHVPRLQLTTTDKQFGLGDDSARAVAKPQNSMNQHRVDLVVEDGFVKQLLAANTAARSDLSIWRREIRPSKPEHATCALNVALLRVVHECHFICLFCRLLGVGEDDVKAMFCRVVGSFPEHATSRSAQSMRKVVVLLPRNLVSAPRDSELHRGLHLAIYAPFELRILRGRLVISGPLRLQLLSSKSLIAEGESDLEGEEEDVDENITSVDHSSSFNCSSVLMALLLRLFRFWRSGKLRCCAAVLLNRSVLVLMEINSMQLRTLQQGCVYSVRACAPSSLASKEQLQQQRFLEQYCAQLIRSLQNDHNSRWSGFFQVGTNLQHQQLQQVSLAWLHMNATNAQWTTMFPNYVPLSLPRWNSEVKWVGRCSFPARLLAMGCPSQGVTKLYFIKSDSHLQSIEEVKVFCAALINECFVDLDVLRVGGTAVNVDGALSRHGLLLLDCWTRVELQACTAPWLPQALPVLSLQELVQLQAGCLACFEGGGEIVGVDSENAAIWPQCYSCGSDQLIEEPSKAHFSCKRCSTLLESSPPDVYFMVVQLRVQLGHPLPASCVITVQLSSNTAKEILNSGASVALTTTHDIREVLHRTLGRLNTIVKRAANQDGSGLFVLQY